MPIHVHAKMYFNGDGTLTELIKGLVEASLKDPGCISYTFYQHFFG